MFDWTVVSSDPNNKEASVKWAKYYNGISELVLLPELGVTRDEFILGLLEGEGALLDIGMAEHTREYISKDSWFHKKIRARYAEREVWGLDINAELIDYIREKFGWSNMVACDATSASFKQNYFCAIHAGDVIEHVTNLGQFLDFCYQSLVPGGCLVLTTPNPHAFEYIKRVLKFSTIPANFEHTCFVTPPTINELCRRTGFVFESSYYLCGKKRTRRARIFSTKLFFLLRELIWYEYLWVLRKPNNLTA